MSFGAEFSAEGLFHSYADGRGDKMTRYSRKLLMVCISLLLVAGLSGVASALEDLDDIISGAVEYIDKYKSGRIAYIYKMESSPYERTDEEIEIYMRFPEKRLRERGDLSEEQISERLDEIRAFQERHRSKKNWTKNSGTCEVVFEGENQHLTNAFFDGVNRRLLERYDYRGNSTWIAETMIREIIRGGGTKPPIHIHEATVRSKRCSYVSVHSILDEYRYVRRVLVHPQRDWALLDRKEKDGEVVYVLADTTSNTVFKHFLEVVPEKGYYIKAYWNRKIGHEPALSRKRFGAPTWNADAQIYYPGTFVQEIFDRRTSTQGSSSRRTLTQTDVRFNIDVPDETFFVPMKENLQVRDYRPDPSFKVDPKNHNHHKDYSFRRPNKLRRFLNELNGLRVREPTSSELGGVVEGKSREERFFAGDVLKALNTHVPNYFDGVIMESKSRMLLRMKEGAQELDDSILERIAGRAAMELYDEFNVPNSVVLISQSDGYILAEKEYEPPTPDLSHRKY